MRLQRLRTMGLVLLVVVGAAGAGWLVSQRLPANKDLKEKSSEPDKVTEKEKGNILRMNSTTAESYGIEVKEIKIVEDWRPELFIDGRVLPNPNTTLDVRAPFAGILKPEDGGLLFRIGESVAAQQTLATFEARFSPIEKLDLKAKSVEAEARYEGAKDVLKIREERQKRLGEIPAGSISRGDLDAAAILLAEARMQKDIALTQWNLWKQALESVGKKSIIVPIKAPIAGEITEIGAQPGANVEAGQLLVRLVDFSRVLVRLDFPLSGAGVLAPLGVDVETLTSSVLEKPSRRHAALRGPAPNIEIGLQKASYLYEIMPVKSGAAPTWRPGLYVKALLPDPARPAQRVVAIPASALLVHQGRTLVYRKKSADRYERLEVTVLGRAGDAVYIADPGWLGDEQIVSAHAQVLLSEEFRSEADND